MGLMTAYFASATAENVVVLEKRTIGNKQAASFSYTRSMRTDYLDPLYARLANESRKLWLDLQQQTNSRLLVSCGCLNLAKSSVTPEVSQTYGAKSYQVISDLDFGPEEFTSPTLQARFPQFTADAGYLDTRGGYFNLPAVTELLLKTLRERGVTIVEHVQVKSITNTANGVCSITNNGTYNAKKLVVTAGSWTNEVLKLIVNNNLVLPLSFDKPKECKYFYPPVDKFELFMPNNFPVFAYLDVGIYGHPIFDRQKGAVKISYYNPTDVVVKPNAKINSVADFVNECLPALRGARAENVLDADQCFYDLVADDNFILGPLPNFSNIAIGTGWRGTGYKFAPLVGTVLSQLSLQNSSAYDISTFSPGRFTA